MYFQTLFLLWVCNAALIYQKTYQTAYLDFNYQLQENQQYLIQMTIIQFPEEQTCLPFLQVNTTDQGVVNSYSDETGFSTKAQVQNVYVNDSQVEITVFNRQLDIIPSSNESKIISFTITIMSSVNQNVKQPSTMLSCYFPSYGTDCQSQIELIETETVSTLIVPQHSWNYYYYILDNYDYELEVNCDWSTFAVAFLPVDKADVTKLPSFNSQLEILYGGQEKKINLNRISNIHDYVFVVGVYNFESEAQITISVTQIDESSGSSFPIWAIVTIVGVVVFGVLISIFIICQLRKQAKVYEEKPKLPIEILDKYMPTKPVPKHQLPESCCVCLVQFLKRDSVRETPCKHFFHDRCLREWTHKNASCPVCRQELNEVEIQKFLCLSQVHSQKNEFNNSHDGSGIPKIPLTQFRISDHDINTRGVIIIDNSPSNGQSHSDRLSINLIEDHIVEH